MEREAPNWAQECYLFTQMELARRFIYANISCLLSVLSIILDSRATQSCFSISHIAFQWFHSAVPVRSVSWWLILSWKEKHLWAAPAWKLRFIFVPRAAEFPERKIDEEEEGKPTVNYWSRRRDEWRVDALRVFHPCGMCEARQHFRQRTLITSESFVRIFNLSLSRSVFFHSPIE